MAKKRPNSEARDYVERWKETGPILERIRRDELRRMTEQDYLNAVERIWSAGVRVRPRKTSGLVEWQRLMSKCRDR